MRTGAEWDQWLWAYRDALKLMWVNTPNLETQARVRIYARWNMPRRAAYITWVEENAEKIAWCGELMATAVACKLGVTE